MSRSASARRPLGCKEETCERPANGSRGYCSRHYRQWLRDGGTGNICAVPDCDGGAWAKGLCAPHHGRASRYGLSVEDLILIDREEHCHICHGPAEVVDHDHETGTVRGVLCTHCNLVLGHAKDSVPTLYAAIQYLTRRSTT